MENNKKKNFKIQEKREDYVTNVKTEQYCGNYLGRMLPYEIITRTFDSGQVQLSYRWIFN